MTKPIQIRDEAAVSAIREAAALSRRSLTEVVREGAQLVLDRERRRTRREDPEREQRIDRLLAEFREAVRSHGGRIPTDDDFYDENGFPK
ncbi:MAG: hypothetical protein E7812_03340 [Phenylobacterium sp.]|nr:MAG: hypothetical protein E7812_03340 [Phenylobacterium sp.]